MTDIYKLKLHEALELDNHFTVLRVPGGWIYRDQSYCDAVVNTFVPFDNEYQSITNTTKEE